jgi:hypothetical protein
MMTYIVRDQSGRLLSNTQADTAAGSKYTAVKLFYCYYGTFESDAWVSSWIWLYNRGFRVVDATNVSCLRNR